MGQNYEVQFAKQLEGVDNFGNVTYSVKFTTESETALWKVQPKNVVQPGTTVFGHIEDKVAQSGKPWRKFVRDQQEFQGQQGYVQAGSTSGPAQGSNGSNNDRADGMRQGMSINNATNLIAAFISSGLYTDSDPKKVVADLQAFAKGIYAIDLGKEPETTPEEVVNSTDDSLLDEINKLGF